MLHFLRITFLKQIQYEARHMTDQGWGYNTTADPPVRPPKGKDPNSTAPVPVRTATELYPGRVIVVCTRTSQVTSCVVSCVLRFSAFGVRVVHVPSDVERRGGGGGGGGASSPLSAGGMVGDMHVPPHIHDPTRRNPHTFITTPHR